MIGDFERAWPGSERRGVRPHPASLGATDRRALPRHRLGPQDVAPVREALAAQLASPTDNRYLCALRKTLR